MTSNIPIMDLDRDHCANCHQSSPDSRFMAEIVLFPSSHHAAHAGINLYGKCSIGTEVAEDRLRCQRKTKRPDEGGIIP